MRFTSDGEPPVLGTPSRILTSEKVDAFRFWLGLGLQVSPADFRTVGVWFGTIYDQEAIPLPFNDSLYQLSDMEQEVVTLFVHEMDVYQQLKAGGGRRRSKKWAGVTLSRNTLDGKVPRVTNDIHDVCAKDSALCSQC